MCWLGFEIVCWVVCKSDWLVVGDGSFTVIVVFVSSSSKAWAMGSLLMGKSSMVSLVLSVISSSPSDMGESMFMMLEEVPEDLTLLEEVVLCLAFPDAAKSSKTLLLALSVGLEIIELVAAAG